MLSCKKKGVCSDGFTPYTNMGWALYGFTPYKIITANIHLNPTWFLLSPPVVGNAGNPLVELRAEGLNLLCV